MKKKIVILLLFYAVLTPSFAQTDLNLSDKSPSILQIEMMLHVIDGSKGLHLHRTPPQIPNIYLDTPASTVYFESPCYECTLELVVPGTDIVAYSYIIPDGDNTVQLPTFLSGEYELHIHRGNFCFWGMIELD